MTDDVKFGQLRICTARGMYGARRGKRFIVQEPWVADDFEDSDDPDLYIRWEDGWVEDSGETRDTAARSWIQDNSRLVGDDDEQG